jgi:hypothetical protein
MIFGMYEACGGRKFPEGGEIELCGTKANLYIDQSGYSIVPTRGGQFQDRDLLTKAVKKENPETESNMRNTPTEGAANLVEDFLVCVKTRQNPKCDLETGHRSNSFSLLANIAEDLKTRIEWDAEKEVVTNNPEANKLLHYEYRKPWKL